MQNTIDLHLTQQNPIIAVDHIGSVVSKCIIIQKHEDRRIATVRKTKMNIIILW